MTGEELARLFHETYERRAPDFGYRTREASAVPWEQVPEPNRSLMIAVATDILQHLGLTDGWPVVTEEMRATVREMHDQPLDKR